MAGIKEILMWAIGVAGIFIIFASIIVPQWNTTAGLNVSGTGLSASAWQGFMMLLGLAAIGFGIYKVSSGKSS